jgi:hypothetical protein
MRATLAVAAAGMALLSGPALASPVAWPQGARLQVYEELATVIEGDQRALVSVGFETIETVTLGGQLLHDPLEWTVELHHARFELQGPTGGASYDSRDADRQKLIGETWTVQLAADGQVTVVGLETDASWLDVATVQKLVRVRLALLGLPIGESRPNVVTINDLRSPALPTPCNGPCRLRWAVGHLEHTLVIEGIDGNVVEGSGRARIAEDGLVQRFDWRSLSGTAGKKALVTGRLDMRRIP